MGIIPELVTYNVARLQGCKVASRSGGCSLEPAPAYGIMVGKWISVSLFFMFCLGSLRPNRAMRIAEIFKSLQGEGLLTGTPSVFVRVSGCNLRCRFCDTPFASWWPEGEHLTVEQIVARVVELGEEHVVLTGGEPMIFPESVEMTERLRALGRHITIETAGTRYLPVVADLISLSPKLSNSVPDSAADAAWARRHEARRRAPDVVRRLVAEYPYQVKFVVDSPADCREVEQYLAEYPEIDRDRVLLMPMGTEAARLAETAVWLEPYCARHGLRFCPRRQVEWFGGVLRGT